MTSFRTLSDNPACNPVCRACHYKGWDYPEQLRRKTEWAQKQLGANSSVLHGIRPAPESERLGYRSKSWLRSHFEAGEVSFGMFRSIQVDGSWEQEFVSWDTCPLHIEPIQQMIAALKKLIAEEAPTFAEQSLEGVWMGSPHLVIVSRHMKLDELRKLDWSKVLAPPFCQIWFHCNPQVGRKVFGHHEILPLHGSPVEGGAHPIRAFRQVARSLLAEARQSALKHLMKHEPELVLDLYCGTGDLALALPPSVDWIGIELSSEAIRYANQCAPAGRKLHAGYVGTVEHRLNDPRVRALIRGRCSLYLNPPRSGLTPEAGERVLEVIRESAPQAIAYLSCSASSLARDLKVLDGEGYRVVSLQPYDFFPQTEHFETLALLERS